MLLLLLGDPVILTSCSLRKFDIVIVIVVAADNTRHPIPDSNMKGPSSMDGLVTAWPRHRKAPLFILFLVSRFGLTSSQSGVLISVNDMTSLVCVLFIGYLGRKVSKPRSGVFFSQITHFPAENKQKQEAVQRRCGWDVPLRHLVWRSWPPSWRIWRTWPPTSQTMESTCAGLPAMSCQIATGGRTAKVRWFPRYLNSVTSKPGKVGVTLPDCSSCFGGRETTGSRSPPSPLCWSLSDTDKTHLYGQET